MHRMYVGFRKLTRYQIISFAAEIKLAKFKLQFYHSFKHCAMMTAPLATAKIVIVKIQFDRINYVLHF